MKYAPTNYFRQRDRQPWVSEAACADVSTSIFYVDQGERVKAAKAVCDTCSVRLECLDYALTNNEEHGVWGGLTEKERRRLKRKRPKPEHDLAGYRRGCRCEVCTAANTVRVRRIRA